MKLRIYIALLISVLFLQSCKLGHKYVKPVVNMPAEFSAQPADTISLAELQWWEIYSDPLLQSLITRALENNKDLLIADTRIDELAALSRQSRSELLPVVGGSAYVQKEGLNYGGDDFKSDPENGLKLTVSWEVDLWGNLRWAKDKSHANLLAQVENINGLRMSLIASIAQAYFELIALDNEYAIVKQTLTARSEGVRIARLRYEGGLTSETSLRQAEVEYARTATYIPQLERNIALKENEISLLLGEYPSDIPRASFNPDVALPQALPVGLPSDLLQRRPDIRLAEQKLIAANAEMGMAYTNRFPRLSLTATGGLESDEFSNFLKSPMYFLSGALLGPVLDMGRRQSVYRAKEAAYRGQLISYEQSVLKAFNDVREAIITFNKVQDIYSTWRNLETAAKANLDLARLQYINGVIGYLDLLDAQRSYFDAQIGLSNAIRNKQLSLVTLYKALGGGWQTDKMSAEPDRISHAGRDSVLSSVSESFQIPRS